MNIATPNFRRILRGLALVWLALALVGCAQMRDRMGSLWPGTWSSESEQAGERRLSGMESAVRLLQQGKETQAKALLEEALAENPESRIARKLMAQITSDPEAMLGRQSRAYIVKRGDSMSELAAEHLGDPLLFYVLARYNDIDVPNRLQAGSEMRLPVAQAVGEASPNDEAQLSGSSAETKAADTAAVALQDAEDAVVLGHWQTAISRLSQPSLQPLSEEALALLGEALRRQTQQAMEQRNFALAEETLSLARQQKQARGAAWPWVDALGSLLNTHRLVTEADALLAKGDDLAALRLYREAEALRSDDPGLAERVRRMAQRVSRQYHESALIQYRNQQLTAAIENWQRALEADPDYEAARVYLTRARELQRRLESLRDQRDASSSSE